MEKWRSGEAHPLVVGRPLRLVLEVVVQRRPGHRQAVEVSHLQGTHLLHLGPQPFLHALAPRRRQAVRRRAQGVGVLAQAGAAQPRSLLSLERNVAEPVPSPPPPRRPATFFRRVSKGDA